jgi:hypothetical protein
MAIRDDGFLIVFFSAAQKMMGSFDSNYPSNRSMAQLRYR